MSAKASCALLSTIQASRPARMIHIAFSYHDLSMLMCLLFSGIENGHVMSLGPQGTGADQLAQEALHEKVDLVQA